MTVAFLDPARQYRVLQAELDAAIQDVCHRAAFVGGPDVAAFEAAFAAYIGVGHCIGVGNGTDALEIALEALALPPGGEVLVPANSYIASAEAVTRAGLTVRFVDCEPSYYTLDPAHAEARITADTVAVMPVHLYGQPCDMEAVTALARRYGLAVIEDCAQAHGATFKGQPVGTFGSAATFSFFPGKNLGAFGDAGAVVTDDADLAQQCRMLANHGRSGKFDHRFEGRNSRLDGLQAAVLSVKLAHLPAWTAIRRDAAAAYDRKLAELGAVVAPPVRAHAEHVYHLYVVRVGQRDAVRAELAERGIGTGIHYPTALPRLSAYARFGLAEAPWHANRLDRQVLSLPMGDHLGPDDVARAVEALAACPALTPPEAV